MVCAQDLQRKDLFEFERQAWSVGHRTVAGVDEVGRGPLAGPVVAAAVILPSEGFSLPVRDSKALSERTRDRLSRALWDDPDVHISLGIVEVDEIDRINILRATHLAMRQALQKLSILPDMALVDGLPVAGLPCPATFIVKGDARSASIAAASIVAKVHRDGLMVEYSREFPGYGFERHKGYGTAEHLKAIVNLGVTPIHRVSFSPVARVISGAPEQLRFGFSEKKPS